MTAIIDIIIVFFLIVGALVGFKRGVIKSAAMFIGAIVAILFAFVFSTNFFLSSILGESSKG